MSSTGSSLRERFPVAPVRETPWWSEPAVRDQLVNLADAEFSRQEPDVGGIYVYSMKHFQKNFSKLKNLKSINKLFYAMKANPCKTLIQEVLHMGAGIECVSLNELKFVLDIMPMIDGSRVMFTPNFASKAEYAAVKSVFSTPARMADSSITQKVPFVTIDNLWVLQTWDFSVFSGLPLFLRVDPGEDGHGHHSYVHTGASSKFGITQSELVTFMRDEVRGRSIAQHIVGLHMHKGSGLKDTTQWAKSAEMLVSLRDIFSNLRYIDLGGGLGVPYKPCDAPLDLAALDKQLFKIVSHYPNITFCIEPGRFVVASCGVLLTRVHQLKNKGTHRFVGVSAGMNHLIRPALYESYHHIVNLSKFDERYLSLAAEGLSHELNTNTFDSSAPLAESLIVNVVGPICETGDFLGNDRVLPRATSEDDVILIDTAGAYGRAMASEYNLRKPGPEFCVDF